MAGLLEDPTTDAWPHADTGRKLATEKDGHLIAVVADNDQLADAGITNGALCLVDLSDNKPEHNKIMLAKVDDKFMFLRAIQGLPDWRYGVDDPRAGPDHRSGDRILHAGSAGYLPQHPERGLPQRSWRIESSLDLALISGQHYHYYKVEGHGQKETAAFREGKILHKILLEFDDFETDYAIEPEWPEDALAGADQMKAAIEAYNHRPRETP
ncbi:UNVERIFIED_CONTAM: hypothetical protein K2H54_000279 [Gekko kuhli]